MSTVSNNVSIEQNNVTHEIADGVTFELLGDMHPTYARHKGKVKERIF